MHSSTCCMSIFWGYETVASMCKYFSTVQIFSVCLLFVWKYPSPCLGHVAGVIGMSFGSWIFNEISLCTSITICKLLLLNVITLFRTANTHDIHQPTWQFLMYRHKHKSQCWKIETFEDKMNYKSFRTWLPMHNWNVY